MPGLFRSFAMRYERGAVRRVAKTGRESAPPSVPDAFLQNSLLKSVSYEKCQFFDDGCVDLFGEVLL